MSTVKQERPPVRQPNETRLAWAGVVLTPVGVLLGLGLGVLTGHLLGLLEGGEPAGTWQDSVPWYTGEDAWRVALMVIPAWLISMVAPVFGLWHGVRASRSGSHSGKNAAVVAGALLVLIGGYGLYGLILF